MSVLQFIFIVLACLGPVAILYFWFKAHRELSEEGRNSRFPVAFLGVFASTNHFTEAGWRYRNISIGILIGTLICAVTILVLRSS